ncbi:Calx-beta domain-containing protein [Albimonas pacifica]|uniref:cellulase n=1 Tax=Albimonas pacifica TaxID=1114924 RepID=A0A1I3NJ08_9RHOB|nr:Calx-beta domain-containing protein [Albimonas pacifica]SFJ09152.1 chitinase [Albimonas pacifica]
MAGTVFQVVQGGGDVIGFDPSRDKLDLGDVSVHNFIVVDTPAGAGFMDPWSGETTVIQGVSLGQLTVDSFLPVINDHLRQCLAGALAWAHGIEPAANTIYARSHEPGRIDRVAFDPETDVVDFRHYGTREQISMTDGAEGAVISNAGTGQTLILLGVSVDQLSVSNFLFYSAQVREDRVHLQLGFGPVPDDRILDQGMPVPGTTAWPTEAGPGAPPSGVAGEVFVLDWDWGAHVALDFDPAVDRLDFGWLRGDQFTLAEVGGSVVIAIDGNDQSYTLAGVPLGAMDMGAIVARDPSARAEWQAALEGAAPAPRLSAGDAQAGEAAGVVEFTVSLSAPASGPATVDWATVAGTARAGEDYVPAVGTLTFAPGETAKTVSVALADDALHEADETFGLRLTSPSGATLARAEATATILDDDPAPAGPPRITLADVSGAEGDAGETHMLIEVSLSRASTSPVTVAWTTADGTATAGEDYHAASGVLTFAPGETAKTLHVHAMGDTTAEDDETLFVRLSDATGAEIADAEARVTLRNDDAEGPAPLPELTISNRRLEEGDDGWSVARLKVRLSEASDAPVTVDWSTVDRTAQAGADYRAASGTLSFAPGETVQTIRIRVFGDETPEDDERFLVRLSNPEGATLADRRGVVRILDDDAAPPPPPPPPAGGEVDYAVRNAWSGGFVAEMTVGAGASALDGWSVSFEAEFEIVNIWNARIVSHEASAGGVRYVLANLDYNAGVPAGGTTGFGFQAEGGDSAVSGLALDGADPPVASPAISVAGAEVVEGGFLEFEISLSAASVETIEVDWAAQDGTARAGEDYAAVSGRLVFAPGETVKTVRVATLDDAVFEGTEHFAIALSSPKGATLGASRAQGAIVDDDPAPVPGLGIGDARAAEGDEGGASPGWFSTSGNQVVDAEGNPVRIAGVNWFGFESDTFAPHGLWTRGYASMMDQMKAEGFNTIRLPFSSEMLHTSAAPNGIDFSQNPDLAGLTPLEILDVIVDYAGQIGMRIILDHHRSTAGAGTSGNGLWYGEGGFTEAGWIEDWRMLAARYADDPTVIGADLHNEPHAGTWGGGGASDWARAAEAAGDAIGEVNPNWLILVEGVGAYQGDSYWWGGALQGVRDRPIELAVADKLVYSPHDYGNSVHAQPWFQSPDFAEDLPEIFREAWGFIFEDEIAPVMLGEFGTRLQDPKDEPWLAALTAYLQGDFDGDGASELAPGQEGIGWTYWSWNPNSGDTGGVLADDWRTVIEAKMAYLEPMQFDLDEGGTAWMVFEVSLTAPAVQEITVDWTAAPGTAGEDDFEAASGTLRFAPGEQTREIHVALTGDEIPEADETFAVLLSNPQGAELLDAEGLGLILNDDAAGLLLA